MACAGVGAAPGADRTARTLLRRDACPFAAAAAAAGDAGSDDDATDEGSPEPAVVVRRGGLRPIMRISSCVGTA